jgi:NAD(P)-dependent dehydrogenase (short-subunit alcohol dehydrogenase family)
MRPIAEQTVLVTGSTDGLGKAVATELAWLGAAVAADAPRLDALISNAAFGAVDGPDHG